VLLLLLRFLAASGAQLPPAASPGGDQPAVRCAHWDAPPRHQAVAARSQAMSWKVVRVKMSGTRIGRGRAATNPSIYAIPCPPNRASMAGIETSRVNLFVEKRTLVRSIVEDRRATDRGHISC
jgi:hypothetical protein